MHIHAVFENDNLYIKNLSEKFIRAQSFIQCITLLRNKTYRVCFGTEFEANVRANQGLIDSRIMQVVKSEFPCLNWMYRMDTESAYQEKVQALLSTITEAGFNVNFSALSRLLVSY